MIIDIVRFDSPATTNATLLAAWLSGPIALNTNRLLLAVVGAQGRPLSTLYLL